MSNQTPTPTLRSRTAKWFECIVRYERQQEDGITKKVTESYIVDALSFTEAEARITKEMQAYISGEFEVKNINPCPFSEIFFPDQAADDRWYKARLAFITIDEKTEKKKTLLRLLPRSGLLLRPRQGLHRSGYVVRHDGLRHQVHQGNQVHRRLRAHL